MDTNRIAELLALVEDILASIKDETTDCGQKKLLGWKILSHLTQVYGFVNSSNVRAPGQLLIGRLVIKEANRLIDETISSIPDIPEEFHLMIKSIKLTGKEDDFKEA